LLISNIFIIIALLLDLENKNIRNTLLEGVLRNI